MFFFFFFFVLFGFFTVHLHQKNICSAGTVYYEHSHAVRIMFILDQARNPKITRNLVLYPGLTGCSNSFKNEREKKSRSHCKL